MTAEPEPENVATREVWLLGALTPPVPPDETQGVLGGRELSREELARAQVDVALITAVAPLAPYARVTEAFDSLSRLVEHFAESAHQQHLSTGARKRVAGALRAFAEALVQLPTALDDTTRGKLDEPEDLSAIQEPDEDPAAYVLACALGSVAVEDIGLLRGASEAELVIHSRGVGALRRAAGIALPDQPLLLLALAAEATHHAARLVAEWLKALSEPLRAASLRVQALAAEVIEGPPAILNVVVKRNAAGASDAVGMRPQPLPLEEIQRVQAFIRKADDVLSEEEREPALRAGSGMLTEEILSTVAWIADSPSALASTSARKTSRTPTTRQRNMAPRWRWEPDRPTSTRSCDMSETVS